MALAVDQRRWAMPVTLSHLGLDSIGVFDYHDHFIEVISLVSSRAVVHLWRVCDRWQASRNSEWRMGTVEYLDPLL